MVWSQLWVSLNMDTKQAEPTDSGIDHEEAEEQVAEILEQIKRLSVKEPPTIQKPVSGIRLENAFIPKGVTEHTMTVRFGDKPPCDLRLVINRIGNEPTENSLGGKKMFSFSFPVKEGMGVDSARIKLEFVTGLESDYRVSVATDDESLGN